MKNCKKQNQKFYIIISNTYIYNPTNQEFISNKKKLRNKIKERRRREK